MEKQDLDEFWQSLWYIDLVRDTKRPAVPWGGYDQVFEEAEDVKSFDELVANGYYGYIDHVNPTLTLGVLDIDVYKDVAPDINEVTHHERATVIKTRSGGFHIPFLVPAGKKLRVRPKFDDWVDLKGAINKGHAVAPHNSDYEVVQYASVHTYDPDEGEHTSIAQLKGEELLETHEPDHHTYDGESPYGSVYAILDPEDYPPGHRVDHPFHSSSTGANFMVDENETTWRCWRHEVTGNLLHLIGVKEDILECGEWKRNGDLYDKYEQIREVAYEEDIRLEEPKEFGFPPDLMEELRQEAEQ